MGLNWEEPAEAGPEFPASATRHRISQIFGWASNIVEPQFAFMAARFLGVATLAVALVSLTLVGGLSEGYVDRVSPAIEASGNARAIAAPPVIPAAPVPVAMIADVPAQLLAQREAGSASLLQRYAQIAPQRLCDAMAGGPDRALWRESEIFDTEWECIADPTRQAVAIDVPVFAMARGRDRQYVQFVRMKTVGDTAAAAQIAGAFLARRVRELLDALHWQVPNGLEIKLQRLQAFKLDEAGTSFHFAREGIDGWRYNLVIQFPKTQALALSSAYQTLSEAIPEP